MGKLIELIKFFFKHRVNLFKLKDELWEVKVKTQQALLDRKISREEAIDILRESDDVLEKLIEILEND